MKKGGIVRLPRAWFLPRDTDTLSLLRAQARTLQSTVDLLSAWPVGSPPASTTVRDLRALLDREEAQRRATHAAVRAAFSTPLAAEDLFELAERLGEFTEAVYMLVREADLTATPADPALHDQIVPVVTATTGLVQAVDALPEDLAAEIADTAADGLQEAEHAYRVAITALEAEPNLRAELRRRELYRRAEHLVAAAHAVARRIWYAVCKIS